MKSHIQISRTIIANFKISKDNGNTIALNLIVKKLEYDKGPRQIGVLRDYFNSDTEKFLSDKYETPFGNVVSLLKQRINDEPFLLKDEEILTIKRFLGMLSVRDPSLIDLTFDRTIIAKTLGIRPTPSCFVKLLEKTNLLNIYFKNHYPVIVYNKTNTSYISTIKGFSVSGGPTIQEINWWLPVSPTIGICFASKYCFEKLYKNCSIASDIEIKNVQKRNDDMIKDAIKQKNKYAFSNDEIELKRILDKLTYNI